MNISLLSLIYLFLLLTTLMIFWASFFESFSGTISPIRVSPIGTLTPGRSDATTGQPDNIASTCTNPNDSNLSVDGRTKTSIDR